MFLPKVDFFVKIWYYGNIYGARAQSLQQESKMNVPGARINEGV